MSHFGLSFFFLKNRWQDSSKEKQEATSEPPGVTQASTHLPPEQCNGSQRDSWEGADYRQDGRAAVQPPCKEQELDGSTTQSVDHGLHTTSPARLSASLQPFLPSCFAVNDAERTACPKQARSKQPKANTGRATPRGRGKGSVFLPPFF